ncbi:hypothetical protein PR048_032138 [Dryococelus australis]|uniref:Uncharacterized protein n=1 Tax=Dryococelus australis TaxID=614101 RepID=A0ABQ9G1D8_9NEOP|nr:hypothetical protein PR048_032138 [Dryococelus australis]
MGLSKQDRSNILDAAWNIGFHFGSLPLSLAKILPVHSTFSNGENLRLTSDEFLQGVLFYSEDEIPRVHIGLIVMLAVSVPAILANITRILITLGKKRSVPFVKFVQYVIFTLHCFAW